MIAPSPKPAKRPLSPLAYFLLVPGLLVGLMMAVVFGLRVFGFINTLNISSSAMAPAICRRDVIFAEAISLASREVRRGEIVVFDSSQFHAVPSMPPFGGFWITRVVALPGDRFQLKNKQVWINGVLAPELKDHQYLALSTKTEGLDVTKETLVPEGQCIALGDNTNNAVDSRHWGLLPVKSVRYVYGFHIDKSPDRSLTPKAP